MADAQVLADFINRGAPDLLYDLPIEDEGHNFALRTSSLTFSTPPTFSQSSSCSPTLTTVRKHLDTAFTAFGGLNNADQQQLSGIYLESYHKSIDDDNIGDAVEYLLRSACIDELVLGKLDLARSRSRNSCTVQGLYQRNLLLEASAGRLVLLHAHTGDCHYLFRALGNLRAAAVLDHGDIRAPRREFHLRITKAAMVVHRKIYEAICGNCSVDTTPSLALQHLRKAITVAGRFLSLIANSRSGGGEDSDSELRDVLSHALTWVLELQSSTSCTGPSIGLHIMHLTRPLPIQLLTHLLLPLPTGVTADHLSTLAKKLKSRYEALPNAPDAKRCLEVAVTMLQCAVDEGGSMPEVGAEGFDNWIYGRMKYLINLRKLRGYWVRRFGEIGVGVVGHAEQEAERRAQEKQRKGAMSELEVEKPIDLALYLHSVAIQGLHIYTHGSSKDSTQANAGPGDAAPDGNVAVDGDVVLEALKTLDGGVAPSDDVAPSGDTDSGGTDTSNREDDWKSRQAKLGGLNEAIKVMRRALDIARKIHLGTVTGIMSNRKRPSLAAWARDLGRLLVAKLQFHIDQGSVFGESGCAEVQQIAEEELKLNGNQRVVRADRGARTVSMGNVAWILFMLYQAEPEERAGFLDRAIRQGRDVLDLAKTQPSDPDNARWCAMAETDARNALSMFYKAEFERMGDLRALQTAAKHTRKSLNSQVLPQQADGKRKKKLVVNLRFPTVDALFEYLRDVNTLAAIFAQRFRKTGEFNELENAIKHQRQIVSLAAPDRILKAGYQVTLANYLEQLYESQRLQTQVEQEKVLEEALVSVQKAWQVLEKSGEMELKAACMNALGSIYKARYCLDQAKYASDLKDAKKFLQHAMAKEAAGTLHISKTGLARMLTTLSQIFGLFGDVKEAVFVAVIAMQWCPPTLFYELAELNYRMGVEMSKIPDDYPDLDTILGPLFKCFREPAAAPTTRLKAALKLCNLLKGASRWEEVYSIAIEAIDLFSLVVIRSLPQVDQQKCLEAFSGFGSLAAAAAFEAHKSPADALMLLEKGRDIIAGNRFDTRIDLTELRSVDKDLAEEFEKLRAQLDPSGVHAYMMSTGQSREPGVKDPSGRLLRANRRLEEVVNKIRSKKGFEGFLKPPNLDQMKDAAGEGSIVVINIAEWRCDAIIVRKGREVESIKLDKLTQEAITQQLGDAPSYNEIGLGITDYPAFLTFLWQCIGYPVLTRLGYSDDLPANTPIESYPRIWWCSTGNASRLPLHAASIGRKRGNVMSRVVSSYTSSIKALIFSRRQAALRRTSPQRGSRALLCSVLSTLHDREWGLGRLISAPAEVEAVGRLITETMSMDTPTGDKTGGTMAKLNVKIEPDPYEADLLDYFTIASLVHSPPPPEEWPAIFHFAGHGVTNPTDPSKSCLYTKDSPLYVEKLVRVGMYERFPLLAYLSACSTGVNVVNGKAGLGDEGIHVMGALQLAGFVGVVGALWRVSDDTAGRVAKIFYEQFLKGDWEEEDRVAQCFHYAVMSLRNTTDMSRVAVSIELPARLSKID